MIIGVMGMSGSGKTTFCSYLKDMGAFVIDADIIAREVLEKGTEGLLKVKETFGEEVILSDGSLNRKKLGSIVFKDKNKLEALNSITSGIIDMEIIKRAKNTDDKIVVIDCPMLHKISAKDICNKIILIKAPDDVMAKRITKRDNISYDDALLRIKSQVSDFESVADIIIENNSDLDSLHTMAKELMKG